MKEECEILNQCGFFKKYQAVKDLACRGFIRLYCRGPKMDQCKRKQYRAEHGVPPSDDMMPSGDPIMISKDAPKSDESNAEKLTWE